MAIKNKTEDQNGGFLGMLSGTLAVSLLGNFWADKPKIPEQGVIRANEGVMQAGEWATATSQGRDTNRAGQYF